MTRWNVDPLKPKPFSPVHSARKFSAVLGTTSERSSIDDPAQRFSVGRDVEETAGKLVFGPLRHRICGGKDKDRRRNEFPAGNHEKTSILCSNSPILRRTWDRPTPGQMGKSTHKGGHFQPAGSRHWRTAKSGGWSIFGEEALASAEMLPESMDLTPLHVTLHNVQSLPFPSRLFPPYPLSAPWLRIDG